MLSLQKTSESQHPTLKGMNIVERHITKSTVEKFEESISLGNETDAHKVLAENPILFEPLLKRVGHHAMWFANKPQILPPLTNGKSGKIPDCLIAGKGSGGVEWFIIELKSPQDKLFTSKCCFSSVANSGLNQLAQYVIHSNEKQGGIRDMLEIPDFKNPQGIFVIGKEEETINNQNMQSLKSFWNHTMHDIEIVSYSKLLSNARKIYDCQKS